VYAGFSVYPAALNVYKNKKFRQFLFPYRFENYSDRRFSVLLGQQLFRDIAVIIKRRILSRFTNDENSFGLLLIIIIISFSRSLIKGGIMLRIPNVNCVYRDSASFTVCVCVCLRARVVISWLSLVYPNGERHTAAAFDYIYIYIYTVVGERAAGL